MQQHNTTAPVWITIQMAMTMASVSRSTINRWIAARKFASRNKGRRLINLESFLKFLDSNCIGVIISGPMGAGAA
jgi:hypothetical protein